jgi:hypothetical protein
MKKIVLAFLLICVSSLKTSAQEYTELYSDLDSISKTNVGSNFYRILRMLNYEYNQINDSLTKEIIKDKTFTVFVYGSPTIPVFSNNKSSLDNRLNSNSKKTEINPTQE